jgi:hypothetical protein
MLPSKVNELVLAYRAGDERSINPVYESLRPFMGYLAKRNGNMLGYDGLDAFSDAEEVFSRCLLDWSPDGGFKYFTHYYKQKALWKLSTNRRKVSNRLTKHVPIPASHTGLLDVDKHDRGAQMEARDTLQKIAALPDGRLRDIVQMKAQGLSNVQVGKKLRLSNQYISKILQEYKRSL